MKVIQTKEEFQQEIQNGKTIALFSADWCPDCVFIKPFMPEIEKSYSGFTFLYLDRDQHIDLCQELDVFGIPSFIAFNGGQEIGRYVNKDRKTKEQIESFLNGLEIASK